MQKNFFSVFLAGFILGFSAVIAAQPSAVRATLATDILCYINSIEEINGIVVVHPPIPMFNVGECQGPQVTQCSNGADDDADGLVDAADPGCHSDGNPNNAGSYDPADNSEFNVPLPQCMDGIDNDHDGLIDYPADPGCSSLADTNETDPTPSPGVENTLALCSDGIDNDGDTLVDLADPDCAAFKPRLTVLKVVSGGSATVSAFQLFVDGISIISGSATTSTVGNHTVSENASSTYLGVFSGACNSNGAVTLAIGDNKTCTLTNTFTPSGGGGATTGVLVVKKVFANGAISPSLFSFLINGLSTTTFNVSGENNMSVATGTYTITEAATSTYMPSYSGCAGVLVTVGATTTCTITNTLTSTSTTPTDVCPNIDGVQTSVPEGKVLSDGNCVAPVQSSGGGGGGGGNGGGGGGGGGVISGPLSVGFSNSAGQVLGAQTEQCSEYLHSYIRFGRQNDIVEVTKLQVFLNDFEGTHLQITGIYDAPTHQAVYTFQAKYISDVLIPWGINQPTGYVYLTTKKKINEIYCKFTKGFPLTATQQAEVGRSKAQNQTYKAPATQPATPPATSLKSVQMPSTTPTNIQSNDGVVGGTSSGSESWWSKFWSWLLHR